ncbi:MAG: DUF5686 and carboxypeptidase regulatory-like domain-containing protein [Flavobacteriaceae bacterium]|nr:DUF5686 and carboxypeptidase regulatory-like domain-containing protein [Flavobacteriaceae bacterium]
MQKWFLVSFLLLGTYTHAQIQGNVTDKNDKRLAFVNIYIENSFIGTTTNDNGDYELDFTKTGRFTLVFKFLGYKTLKKEVNIQQYPYKLNVILQPERVQLNEVVIKAAENPANRIIKATIAKKKEIQAAISAYKADFYSRGIFRIKDAPERFLGQDIGDLGGGLDSTRTGVLYLSETVSKIDYQYPNKFKERIIASKVSGDDNGFSFNAASEVQFNLYENTVEMGNKVISPLADYAFDYYRYTLEGVFYDSHKNMINKIRVKPRRDQDNCFNGHIYIVEDQWTIYASDLTVLGRVINNPVLDTLKVQQNFNFLPKEKYWMLATQSIDFSYKFMKFKGNGRFTAVYRNYELQPKFTPKHFGNEIVKIETNANRKDSVYWEKYRPIPLTQEEITDYIRKDSIQYIRKSKKYLDSIDKKGNKLKPLQLLLGYSHANTYKNTTWSIDTPLLSLGYNTVQGWNGDFSFRYTKAADENYFKFWQLGANLQYGLSDEQVRATGRFTYKFNNVSRPFLTVEGGTQLQQFNNSPPISSTLNSLFTLFAKENYAKYFENTFARVSYSQEYINGLRIYTALGYQQRQGVYNTTNHSIIAYDDKSFSSNNPIDATNYVYAPFANHHLWKLQVRASIRFGQKYHSRPNHKVNIPSPKYPLLDIAYDKAFAAKVSDYNYDKLSVKIRQQLPIGNKGESRYAIHAGTFFNEKPIAFMDQQHFNGNAIFIRDHENLSNFMNLPYYSHSTSGSFLEMHTEHNFQGFIMNRIPLLKHLKSHLVGGYKLLSTNQQPYMEWHIGLDNLGIGKVRILRIDYVRSIGGVYDGDAVLFSLKL